MRILYATDGSNEALAGAHLLARLPLTAECQLTLITVLPEADKVDAEGALSTARAVLRDTAASIETEVHRGNAAQSILTAIEARPTDLVVVGSRGLSGLERLLLGSVAERVARHATSPVLVARPLANDLRRVVLAFDGSERVARAAEWLQRFPLPRECELRIATVLPLPATLQRPRGLDSSAGISGFAQQQFREAEQRAAELATAFAQVGRRSEAIVRSGEPADTLIAIAMEHEADLIVVGARGISARDRYLLGSVSERVLRHAPCSVLVVK